MQSRAVSADDVAETLDRLSDALTERERRSALTLGLGANDARMLRHLLAESGTELHTPATIARFLGISSASVTALIDRLESIDLVERVAHPTDRRSITVRARLDRDPEVDRVLSEPQATVRQAPASVSVEEREVIERFLADLVHRLD